MAERILLSTRKGLLTLERSGGGWGVAAAAFAGIPVTNAMRDPRDGALYAALKHGHFGTKLHRSEDGGRSWQELAAPAFPPDTPGAPSLFQIWTIEPGGAGERGRLWAGAIPAGLFCSDDRGETWRLATALWNVPERAKWFGGGYDAAGIHTISPDPRDPRRIFVAISCGGVWDSADGGESWTLRGDGMVAAYMPPDQANAREIQDPHRVARCAAVPEVMWTQYHNGIFRSVDAGASWVQLAVPGDDFGFAVAAHPKDPQTAWFVPAIKDELRIPRGGALCVTRTRDGGKTWETLREGLPQRDAYDLVYRHGLDVDERGSLLAMGSTTGALWVSENAGERWLARRRASAADLRRAADVMRGVLPAARPGPLTARSVKLRAIVYFGNQGQDVVGASPVAQMGEDNVSIQARVNKSLDVVKPSIGSCRNAILIGTTADAYGYGLANVILGITEDHFVELAEAMMAANSEAATKAFGAVLKDGTVQRQHKRVQRTGPEEARTALEETYRKMGWELPKKMA